jgi:hypothetical protein
MFLRIPAVRADSLLSVVIPGAHFSDLPDETVALSFDWDTTAETLYNMLLDVQGPISGFTPYGSPVFDSRDGGISIMDFYDFGLTNLLQIYEPDTPLARILPSPGTYVVKWELIGNTRPGCIRCEIASDSYATVTNLPEPPSALLLLFGLSALGFLLYRNRNHPHLRPLFDCLPVVRVRCL